MLHCKLNSVVGRITTALLVAAGHVAHFAQQVTATDQMVVIRQQRFEALDLCALQVGEKCSGSRALPRGG